MSNFYYFKVDDKFMELIKSLRNIESNSLNLELITQKSLIV